MDTPTAKDKPDVQLLLVNRTDYSFIIRINGREYEYFMNGAMNAHEKVVRGLIRNGHTGKLVSWIKKAAVRCEPL